MGWMEEMRSSHRWHAHPTIHSFTRVRGTINILIKASHYPPRPVLLFHTYIHTQHIPAGTSANRKLPSAAVSVA